MALPEDLTKILLDWNKGEKAALDKLIPIVYEELRRIAGRHLRKQRSDHTLQTTALVHEAYLKLAGQNQVNWQDRVHFFAVAAQVMRHILVNHALARNSAKRGGGAFKLTLEEDVPSPEKKEWEILAVDNVLKKLTRMDQRRSRIVELRFFGGLSHEEIAEVLGTSLATVNRDWRMTKAWLYSELTK